MPAKLNITVIKAELLKAMNKPFYIDLAYNIANKEIITEKNELLKKFDDSQVTKELHPGAVNVDPKTGKTNSKLVSRGSLYGFLGFTDSNPTEEVRYLLNTIKLKKTSRGARYKNQTITYEFPLDYPTEPELFAVTPMPWGTMKSWLLAIEEGLDNFAQYFGKQMYGRSREGIQIKAEMSGGYTPPTGGYVIRWMKELLNKFGWRFGK